MANSDNNYNLEGTENPCVFILGMHRSGTSCLAGMLQQFGLYLGEVNQQARFNKKGNRESEVARVINDELLTLNGGGSWRQPREIGTVSSDLKLRIKNYCRELEKMSRPWGIKDPRMLFCLPAWIKSTPTFVGTFRHPAAVAHSLNARCRIRWNPIRFFKWQKLWFQYNERLVSLYRERPFPMVNFDWEPHRYCRSVKSIARWHSLKGDGEGAFDESLRHQRCTKKIRNRRYSRLYGELLDVAEMEEKKLL